MRAHICELSIDLLFAAIQIFIWIRILRNFQSSAFTWTSSNCRCVFAVITCTKRPTFSLESSFPLTIADLIYLLSRAAVNARNLLQWHCAIHPIVCNNNSSNNWELLKVMSRLLNMIFICFRWGQAFFLWK